jgi:hypothetical protein
MMLTGRRLEAPDGARLGIAHETAAPDELEARAHDLARQIATNAPLTNQLILAALPRVSDMSRGDGLWAEALTTALTQSTADAHEGLQAFLEKALAGLPRHLTPGGVLYVAVRLTTYIDLAGLDEVTWFYRCEHGWPRASSSHLEQSHRKEHEMSPHIYRMLVDERLAELRRRTRRNHHA